MSSENLVSLLMRSASARASGAGLTVAVVDLLWGDCGKAAVLSYLIERLGAMVAVRFNGGCNAGHTMVIDGTKFVTHLVPTSVVYGGTGVIGPGCVMVPCAWPGTNPGLREEIAGLQNQGVQFQPGSLVIDPDVALSGPWHFAMEARSEGGGNRIGSTGRAIAPTYESVSGKWRVTIGDCLLESRLDQALRRVEEAIRDRRSCDGIDVASAKTPLLEFGRWLGSFGRIVRADQYLATLRGRVVLLEGAQGALLDVHRSQPCSTSSSIWPPLGLGRLGSLVVLGVTKVIPTRVGDGPHPTEIEGEEGKALADHLKEYGATTGRKRRVGWPFMPAIREGAFRTSADCIVLTKLDPLVEREIHGFDSLSINGRQVPWWESEWGVWDKARPGQCSPAVQVGEGFPFPTIDQPFQGATRKEELPQSAIAFVKELARRAGVPVSLLKTGPGSQDMVVL